MIYQIIADLIVILHFIFIIFALVGGLLVLKWRRVAWGHLPAVLWAAFIEFTGGVCPLTPLENWLRLKGGNGAYQSEFIENYIMALIYPAALTPQMQMLLGLIVITINLAVYAGVWRRTRGLKP